MKNKFNSWPYYTNLEARKISNILLSNKVNYWTGEEGIKFEEEFAKFSDSKYSIAVSNGTLALELALIGLDIKKGDEVIVTPRSYIASVSCVATCGAIPIFADVDLETGNISPNSVEKLISKKTKAIICVHLGGLPCDIDNLKKICRKNNIKLIEDCSQAHGAKYKNKSVGSYGDIGTWSFCQDKIMSTGGEGGMVTTNSKKLWNKMWAYKDHGKNFNTVFAKKHPPGYRWLHESFGSNFRMTEIQASIGRIQLRKMKSWNRLRTNNAKQIVKAFSKFSNASYSSPVEKDSVHAWYKCNIYLKQNRLNKEWNRDKIANEIIKLGVPCFSGSCSEIYNEKAFDNTGMRPKKKLSNAYLLGKNTLMFLVHPSLSRLSLKKTIKAIELVMTKASK
tara:strand:+ start:13472 stop:14647 length:1176 start_codon:yes stop_codon:yes gene_type:complete